MVIGLVIRLTIKDDQRRWYNMLIKKWVKNIYNQLDRENLHQLETIESNSSLDFDGTKEDIKYYIEDLVKRDFNDDDIIEQVNSFILDSIKDIQAIYRD